jgi:hypothetical protein
MAVNQSAKSSPEHSAHARARVRDIAQRSVARSEGSAVATFNQWQISAVVMSILAGWHPAALYWRFFLSDWFGHGLILRAIQIAHRHF